MRGLGLLSFGLEGGYLFSLIFILLLSFVTIFLGTLSYVSTSYFSLSPSSSFVDPSMTVSLSPENLLYPFQQHLSMSSQGLCKGTLLPIVNFIALIISAYGKRRSASCG